MKKQFFAFLIFCFSASMHAQEKKVFSVLMKDGTSVCFYLSEQPLVTFVDDAVKIESASEEALVKRSLVERFEFLAEMPTVIEDVEADNDAGIREGFELTGNAVVVNGLAAGCKVQLFSVDGKAMMFAVAAEDGNVTLSLDALSQGVYLVNYNETTIKFIKR